MAWPPQSELEASSSSTSYCAHKPSKSTRNHRNRTKKFQSSSLSSVPSAKLLFLLSTIVSTSTASASPAPPSFLCPHLGSKPGQGPCYNKRSVDDDPSLNNSDNNASETQSDTTKLRWVPDKYEEGPDGIWRRVDSYTLYGATVPSSCDGLNCKPTHTMSSIGDTKSDDGTTISVDMQLPPGWTPTPKTYCGRTTVILAVSLALSLSICFLIIICLFKRKSVIHKTSSDLEAKIRRHGCPEDLTDADLMQREHEKEAKAMQKLWARATARWRANARYTLRQRRVKRMTRSLHTHQSSVSIHDSRSHLASSRPSLVPSSVIPQQREGELSSSHDQQSTSTRANHIPSRPSSPPAYHRGHGIPPIIVSSNNSSTPCGHSTPSHLSLTRQHSQLSLYSPTTNPTQSSPGCDLFPPTAHVATDDKALLARLADLASAPPENNEDTACPQVSVPEWHEELELETFGASSPSGIANIVSSSSLFPPPPSKERLAAAERLEYAFAYDDLENVEPEPEPSAPPFEEGSTSPLDGFMLPSAPPMIDSDDLPRSYLPNAPAFEEDFPHPLPSQQDNIAGQDHERIVV